MSQRRAGTRTASCQIRLRSGERLAVRVRTGGSELPGIRVQHRLARGWLPGRILWQLHAAGPGSQDAFLDRLRHMFGNAAAEPGPDAAGRLLDAVADHIAASRSLAEAVMGLIALERKGGDEGFVDWLSARSQGRERTRHWHRRLRGHCGGGEEPER